MPTESNGIQNIIHHAAAAAKLLQGVRLCATP